MVHKMKEEGAWFAPKRFGYGASWPIAWQGWLALALYIGAMGGTALMTANGQGGTKPAGFAVMLLLTGLFMLIAARRTRGGWKWRSGGEE